MDWVIPFGKGRVYVTMLGHLWKGKPDTAMIRSPANAVSCKPLLIKWQRRGLFGTADFDDITMHEVGSTMNLLAEGSFEGHSGGTIQTGTWSRQNVTGSPHVRRGSAGHGKTRIGRTRSGWVRVLP